MIQLPEEFVERMQKLLGKENEKFLAELHTEAPVSIRVNPVKKVSLEKLSPVSWSENGYYLRKRPSFTLDPLFHAGTYYVQEAGSMFLEQAFCQVIPENIPLKVLDLCAAPGGKSTLLSSLITNESLLVSNEVIRSRSFVLSENLKKWGNPNVIVTNNDPRDFQSLQGFFDVVVVDAPCSGEGLFRKDNSAIKEWSVDNAQLCAARQKRILSDIWDALKPGGVIIYSTCTYNPEENELNIHWLLNQFDAQSVPLEIHSDWGIRELDFENGKGYQCYPHLVKGEGFFLAVVKKGGKYLPQKSKKQKKGFETATKNERAILEMWINPEVEMEFINHNNQLLAFPKQNLGDALRVKNNLRIVHMGVAVAEIKKKNINPLHELALSPILNRDAFPKIEVGLETALHYLRKEEIKPESGQKGWNLICYQTTPLGWIKNLGNRFNNNYPKEWRIRNL